MRSTINKYNFKSCHIYYRLYFVTDRHIVIHLDYVHNDWKNHCMSMSKHPIKESEINICKGLFVCMCLFSLRICCKGYTHYSKSSALHYIKVTGDKERGWRCLIHSDCIWKHVLKILANGIYHIRKNTYMRKAQIRTEAATLATSVLTNVAVFS